MTKPPNPELIEKIKNATIELLANDGEKGIKVRKIAKMVGVTPTTIYYYFANKEELITKVSVMIFEDFNRYVDERIVGSTPPERLSALGSAMIDYAFEKPTLFSIMFNPLYIIPHEELPEEEYRSIYYHTYNLCIDILEDGIELGYFECDDPHAFAAASICYFYGVFELYNGRRIPPPYTLKPEIILNYLRKLQMESIIPKMEEEENA